MNLREYHDQNSRLWAEVDAKNKEVDKFAAEHENLLGDGVYEKYWELHNEATAALGKVLEFQENNKHKITH